MMGPSTVAVIAAALAGVAAINADATAPGLTAKSAATATATTNALRGRVSAVSVVPGANGADIVIAVDAAVAANHFTLEGPHRLVIDLGGASLGLRARNYDGVVRGPIRNVRLSQFRDDTVRLVIDLDSKHTYQVDRQGAEVRVSVQAPVAQFARWDMSSSTSGAPALAAAPVAAPKHQEAAGRLADESQKIDAVKQEQSLAQQTASLAPAPKVEVPQAPAKIETPKNENAKSFAGVREGFRDLPETQAVPVATTPAAARRQQQQQKPRITVNYDGTDIRDVIATFATFSGRTIVVGKDVAGTVTADINDKPWDVALQAILTSQGLSATEDASGILTVDSYKNLASNQSLEPLVTQIVDVNYAKASALEQTVQKLLARDCTGLQMMATGRELGANMNSQSGNQNQSNGMSGQGCVVRGSVASDSATNKLIITEVPSRLPEIVARLAQLDIRTQQVAIKAKIIFVNRTGIQDIGLAYDLGQGTKQFFQQLVPRTDPSTLTSIDTDGDGVPDAVGGGSPFSGPARIALGGNALAGISNANNAIKPNALNLIYSTALGRFQLTAFLNALSTSSLADVQSEPSVTILNNKTATIFVGQEIPIRVIDASAGGSGGGGGGGGGAQGQPNAAAFYPRATVSKEEAGIKLTVTPQITNNRMVLMNIIAENSSAELSNTDVGVIFNRQKVESQVLVADGEAAVMGGLTVTETNKFRSGIPVLMNLPFIGKIFSQNTNNETKRDLLILVTPHILEDGSTPPPGR